MRSSSDAVPISRCPSETRGEIGDDLRRMHGARRSTPSKLPIHRSVGEHVGKQEDEGLKKLIESHVEEEESPDGETVRLLPGDWCPACRGPSRAFPDAAVAC
jgi:hypothetical protein